MGLEIQREAGEAVAALNILQNRNILRAADVETGLPTYFTNIFQKIRKEATKYDG
jgi:hypothetical protein